MPARVVREWTRPDRQARRPDAMPIAWGTVGPQEDPVSLYVHNRVWDRIVQRSKQAAERRMEDMGLMVGDWARDGDGRVYAVAWDLMTGPLDASPVSVRYSPDGLMEVARGLHAQERDYVIAGWYHSHLDLGVFMSERDLRTQRGGFPHAHQVALVVDPMRELAGAFRNGPDGPGTRPCVFTTYASWDEGTSGPNP